MVLCFEERVFILSTVDKAGAGDPKETGGRVLIRAAQKQRVETGVAAGPISSQWRDL